MSDNENTVDANVQIAGWNYMVKLPKEVSTESRNTWDVLFKHLCDNAWKNYCTEVTKKEKVK